jgi:hypothetical protein
LVVAGGVEREFAQEFAGGGVDDADVAVLDQEQDVGSGVGSSDADVVQSSVVAQGDDSGGVDVIAADPGVGWDGRRVGGRGGLQAGEVGRERGAAVEGAVRSAGVVLDGEPVEQSLKLGNCCGLSWLRGQPLFQRLMEAFDFPAGLRVVG